MGPTTAEPAAQDLQRRLEHLMLRDERRLGRRLDGVRRVRNPQARARTLAEIAGAVDRAQQRVETRRASVPAISYPPALPVSQRRDDLLAAIRDHQVVVVAGETGSGKTTQLPKLCLELGRGVRGAIGHTQPRRIAARAVAERIAEELDVPLGRGVGYTVRFSDQTSDDTLVKVMTDGVLLAELQRDRLLSGYDTIIVDEAHERSLNIDFILGYLRQLLPRRPDLKVIITSATIDPQRFSRHFDGAPVIEVSGRTYPVEIRYRPPAEEAETKDQTERVCEAVEELLTETRGASDDGDILVFLSGEREIRDTSDALRRMELPRTELVPLYARLSAAEQHRVFARHTGRRIVLATNVAETSLTVPGIRYVVDAGTARISRYSHRTKVQRLPIEPISQASANQRSGRCGRVADGICIRLYAEEDYLGRPEFTDPEILRTNLASVILQMTALELGDVAAFPFVDPPEARNIRDGVQLLEELGALQDNDGVRRLTEIGRTLAELPLDPRLARMVLEADRFGVLHEVLVIAAAISIQDPRERPVDAEAQAAQSHARFADKESDFVAYLNLWNHLREQQDTLSSSAFRRMCKAEYLHYLRVREWQDLYQQLAGVARGLKMSAPDDTVELDQPRRDRVHQALLSGLLSNIGVRDVERKPERKDSPERKDRNERGGDFIGARGARFAVFPGSALFRRPPRWVMAGELVETSRLWARVVGRIEPQWVEQQAEHLLTRTYSEPSWDAERGSVMAVERVSLYGIPIVAGRRVTYSQVDPELCRELFLRHALVEGQWHTPHRFYHANRALLADVEDLEHRARRRDLVVDDDTLYDFYDKRIPAEVVSARHFDAWWKQTRRTQPELLTFDRKMLLTERAAEISEEDYPDAWRQGDLVLPLSYQFEPGADADGVTVHVPVSVLNRLSDTGFDWQVPGLRLDLVTALIRSLPKHLRRSFVPAPDHARAVLPRLGVPGGQPLLAALERELQAATGTLVTRGDWELERVPAHLTITFRVEDDSGHRLAEGKQLDELKRMLAKRIRGELAQAAPDVERTGATSWQQLPASLPEEVEHARGGHLVRGYPALVDEGGTVALRVLPGREEQQRAMRAGTRKLLLLTTRSPVAGVLAQLPTPTKLGLAASPYPSAGALFDDCLACAVDALLERAGGPVRDGAAFAALRDAVAAGVQQETVEVITLVARILDAWRGAERAVRGSTSLTLLPALADVRDQLARLVYPGFVSATGRDRLPDLLRYLEAVQYRLEKLPERPERDRGQLSRVAVMQEEFDRALDSLPPGRRQDADVRAARWLLEELRVSLFAQQLGTPSPVSEKRIRKALAELSR